MAGSCRFGGQILRVLGLFRYRELARGGAYPHRLAH